jgi:hypothetical protein
MKKTAKIPVIDIINDVEGGMDKFESRPFR